MQKKEFGEYPEELENFGNTLHLEVLNLEEMINNYEDSGYFQVKEETYQYGDETRAYSRIFFTGKGEMWITNKIQATEKWGTK